MSERGYVPERGYWIGPDLPVGETPFPLLWEQRPGIDACLHEWERVVVTMRGRTPEPVVRCIDCHIPRCGSSTIRNPCMDRLHHRTPHLRLNGAFDPVGGLVSGDGDE